MLIIVRETRMNVCIGNYIDPSNECTAKATFLRKEIKTYVHCFKYILFQGDGCIQVSRLVFFFTYEGCCIFQIVFFLYNYQF